MLGYGFEPSNSFLFKLLDYVLQVYTDAHGYVFDNHVRMVMLVFQGIYFSSTTWREEQAPVFIIAPSSNRLQPM